VNVLGFIIALFYFINIVVGSITVVKSDNVSVVRRGAFTVVVSVIFLTLLILFGTGSGVL